MTLGYHARHSDGSFLHAELMRGEASIFAVSESDDGEIAQSMLASRRPTMSYGINLDDDDQLAHAYRTLAEGGHILRELGQLPWSPRSADLVDRYGVCWYLYVSQHRPGRVRHRARPGGGGRPLPRRRPGAAAGVPGARAGDGRGVALGSRRPVPGRAAGRRGAARRAARGAAARSVGRRSPALSGGPQPRGARDGYPDR